MAITCFHCGGPIQGEKCHAVMLHGVAQAVCCSGCEAAANLIIAQGLERYYQFRSASESTSLAGRETQQWQAFDRDAALARYTHLRADGERELSLRIDDLHCAACAWLIENSLARLNGVTQIQVNPASARAEVRFDQSRVALSRILERLHTLGYRARPLSFSEAEPAWERRRHEALKRLGVAGFGMMAVMTYAASLYAGAMDGIAPELEQLLRFVSLSVATPVVLYSAQPFFSGAWRGLRSGTLGMDLPVALSIAAAYLWSVLCTLRGSGTVYYDSAVMFTFFLLVGRYIELSLRARSGFEHDALAQLLPHSAQRVRGAEVERVLPEELQRGDRVRVLPGERVAADGKIIGGQTEIDESLLTGESAARARKVGETVIAGTLNLSGVIDISVARVGQDSTLAAMSRLLEQARAVRPRIASIADRVAGWFVAAVLLLAALAFAYWWQVQPERAFPIALAILVATCPCALSLATPAALAAASVRLARDGLLLARGHAIERLVSADCVVFDKTGTLTRGEPTIDQLLLFGVHTDRARCLGIAAALERHSEHPIARAFAQIAPVQGLREVQVAGGRGLQGQFEGRRYRIGRADYVLEPCAGRATPDPSAGNSGADILLGDEHGAVAGFVLRDALRPDAAQTVQALRTLGLNPMIASGDHAAAVDAVARRVNIDVTHANLSAAEKLTLVRELQAAGHVTVVVGDGVNDAPVLAAADISVAIGGGSDLARLSADIVMLGEGLGPLALSVRAARRALQVIRQNILWAILYNATAVPMAALGWLSPWMASVGMSASSLLVVLNAMRLLKAVTPPAQAPSASATSRSEVPA
jgi:Cu2+-exporting ATPase